MPMPSGDPITTRNGNESGRFIDYSHVFDSTVPTSASDVTTLEEYRKLVDKFEERLGELISSSYGNVLHRFPRPRIPKVSHLLCVALRLVSIKEFCYIRQILGDYQESLYGLLLRHVRALLEDETAGKKIEDISRLCTEAGITVDEAVVEKPQDLAALADRTSVELREQIRECDENLREQDIAIQGITPIIKNADSTSQSKGVFERARDGILEAMQEVKAKRSRACHQLGCVGELKDALNFLMNRGAQQAYVESDLETALGSLWQCFLDDVMILAEARAKQLNDVLVSLVPAKTSE